MERKRHFSHSTRHQHRNARRLALLWRTGISTDALTVTVGLGPDVTHAVVEQIEQHQSITVQQNVLAAFVARARLETHSHFISNLTGLRCFHGRVKKVKRPNWHFLLCGHQHHGIPDHETHQPTTEWGLSYPRRMEAPYEIRGEDLFFR